MRYLVLVVLWMLPQLTHAQEWEDRQLFNSPTSEQNLRVLSSTDTSFFAPIIESFLRESPEVSVEYLVLETAEIDRVFRATPEAFDVVISSAMDLQLKIANDGLARQLPSISLPSWAQWRQTLFGFTLEPAAIVINQAAFAGYKVPGTRQELIEAMRARPEVFRGRVGTYDVRQSGLGYLFATQDARASETYWRLMEVMGAMDVRLYCCSGDMIDDLSDGTIAVAYNVLGSYATARVESKDKIEVVLPSDFATTMMRTAMVSKDAPHAVAAEAFVRHLIEIQTDDNAFPLPKLQSQIDDVEYESIALGPALMTFLDTLKRRRFLAEWEDAVIQN